MSESNISETPLNLHMSDHLLLSSEGVRNELRTPLYFQEKATSQPCTPCPITRSASGDQTHLLPKVIYFPEQWSDSVEVLEQTQQESVAAQLVECVFESVAPQDKAKGNPPKEIEPSSCLPKEQNSFIEATILNSSDAQLTISESTPLNDTYQMTQNTEWFTLARKLRQQNRELVKTVVNLEQAIAESQHQLYDQKRRAQSAETLLKQQTQALTKTQQNLNQCTQELEKAQQETQTQELILDNLSQQLESSQEQAAQLERECAFLQENNNEKTQKLIFLEQQVQELRSRLHRQQRYTLQYKVALDQCLEFSQTQIDSLSTAGEQLPKSVPYQVTSKVKSIQAWSSNWQEISPVTPPEKSAELVTHIHPETGFSVEENNDEFSDLITVSLDVQQEAVLEEENKEHITDINLSIASDNIDEDEVDTLLDEFLASFEPDEPVSSTDITNVSSNGFFPLSYSISPIQKPLSKIVELPGFLRKSSH